MVFFRIDSMFYTQNLLIKIIKNQMASKGGFIFSSSEAEKWVSQLGYNVILVGRKRDEKFFIKKQQRQWK